MSLFLGSSIFLLLCAGLFGPLERLFPHSGKRQAYRAMMVCIGLFALNTALMEFIAIPLLMEFGSFYTAPVAYPALRIIATLVIADLAAYGIHRLMHANLFLWRFHRIHHQPLELTWSVAWRQHPIDFIAHGLIVGIPGLLLGVDLSNIFVLVLLRKMWTSFLHADVSFRFGWLEWVVATPAFHRLHHSQDPQFQNRNFSGSLPLWDMLFRTAAREPGIAAGVSSDRHSLPQNG